jgi:hypothetical protein
MTFSAVATQINMLQKQTRRKEGGGTDIGIFTKAVILIKYVGLRQLNVD